MMDKTPQETEGTRSPAPTPHGVDSTAIHRYGKLRLELAEIVRSVLDRARERKNEDIEHRARRLLARLSEDRFYLAVVGQHKRGKSSLMNAIIGQELLPTGILPVTSAIVALRYDSELSIQIHRRASSFPLSIKLEELAQYVSEQGNPGNRKQVETAEVGVPADLLRYGFYLVDTPGIGSAIAANTATTESFLPEAEAAIFVTSVDSPMNELELAFLDKVRQHVHKMFFVVNKSDLVSATERDEVSRFVSERIGEHVDSSGVKIYVTSATEQMRAVKHRHISNGDSGIEELTRDLQVFLVGEKTREFLTRVAQRTASLLESERFETQLAQWTLRNSDGRSTLEAAIDRVEKDLAAKAERKIEELRQFAIPTIESQFRPDLEKWCAHQAASAAETVGNLFRGHRVLLSIFDVPDRLEELRTSVQAGAGELLTASAARLDAAIHAAVAPHASEIASLASAIVPGVVRELGRAAEAVNDASEIDPVAEIPVRVSINAPRFEWDWRPPWWCFLVPAPFTSGRLTRMAVRSLSGAFASFEESLEMSVTETWARWLEELKSRFEQALGARARNLRESLSGNNPQERIGTIGTIESQSARLTSMERELTHANEAKTSGSDVGATLSGPSPSVLGPCVICTALSNALYGFLAKYQYDLAVNEQTQIKHAERGGFCPLHTWMYESVASPQGVSTGYALTLEVMGQRLRSIAGSSSPPGSSDEVDHALPDTNRCPACGVLRNAQSDFVGAQARSVRNGSRPSLCLSHMNLVLKAIDDIAIERELLLERAAVLDRLAEDMRLFALKNDALRHHLKVADEVNAYRRALQQLVGEKNLAVARRVD